MLGEGPPHRDRACVITGEPPSGGRCKSRRAAREARERGEIALPQALEAPLYRPFALLALGVTLGIATPIGAVALYRLYAPVGRVPITWPSLHAHLQVFGFAGVLIMGVGQHLLLRFSHGPIRRHKCMPWILGLVALGLLARLAAPLFPDASLWLASGGAESLAYAVFAVWVTARIRATEPRFTSDWLLVTGAWWLAAALVAETIALLVRVKTGGDPAAAVPGPGLYAMGLYGGIFGWILGVAMRVAPMFLAVRKPRLLGGAILVTLNGAVILGVLAEGGSAASRHTQILQALSELGVAAALIVGALSIGAWRPQSRQVLALHLDQTEARFFRFAFASAGLAAAGLILGAGLGIAGTPRGLLVDVTRHLLTVGFVIGMVCAVGFRFLPVIEGVPLSVPGARAITFWTLAAATLLRTLEVGADYWHEAFLRPAAVSGFLAWLALGCWGIAVGLTMIRGATARRPSGEKK
ncbi:MAG TPA: hypothetical protein VLT62_27220 [Candidatus Methylomirabilis sp.]|nr:hypothetical protein [Candidatus Methylomirabilis sp.]